MSWLTDFVRPKIQAFMNKPHTEISEDLWVKCPQCEQMIFYRDLQGNFKVCPYCFFHQRLSCTERFHLLFDEKDYQIIPLPSVPEDPLHFKDSQKYIDRLRDYRQKTKQTDVLLAASGKIKGHPVLVSVMNFDFMGGSMGLFVGKALVTAVEWAVQYHQPMVIVAASGGARMQEGIFSLMQMPTTVMAVEKLNEARLPYLVVLTDPTMGGVSASFAMLGDVHIAETGALIGFAGPRVIEETIKQKLPKGFQRAEFLKEHGIIDIVLQRKDLKETLGRILSLLSPATP